MRRPLARIAGGVAAVVCALSLQVTASNHREAPITALDPKADITDLYAFRSYGAGSGARVTLILCVDPLLDPANGPNWVPFDDEILYEIKIDNNHDAKEDITLQFRFETEQRLPSLFQVYAGVGGSGASAPANSPAPVPPGTLIVPPQITSFASPGLGQRQRYSVRALGGNREFDLRAVDGRTLYAVTTNGLRTMDYPALYSQGVHDLPGGIQVFAGTTDDPFWIDLGAASTPSTCAVPSHPAR